MSDAPSRFRVGVLSRAHVHADAYLRLLASTSGVEVLVSDPDASPAPDRGAEGLPAGVEYVDSYQAVFERRPDAVVITSETARHRALVEAAAATGAAILCEKPLATTAEDARAIGAIVGRFDVPFMIAYPVRFMAPCAELIARSRAGQLGELVAIRGTNNGKLPAARPWFVEPAESGGGALFDHVVHLADLVDALGGARPVTVSAITNRLLSADHDGAAETGGLVLITYDTGLVAAIDCSWSLPSAAPSWGGLTINITSTSGEVFVDAFRPRIRGIAADGKVLELPYGEGGDAALIQAFLDLARTRRSSQPDLGVALRTLAVVLAAAESATTGRTVSVAELG